MERTTVVWEEERERQCPILKRKNYFVAVKRGWRKDFFFKLVPVHTCPSFPGVCLQPYRVMYH